jgi:alkylated DNA repair dioxygenase AlkB
VNLHLANAHVTLDEQFLSRPDADRLMTALRDGLPWEQRDVVVQGRTYPQPRLTAWFGDAGQSYTYSGLTLEPNTWTPELEEIRDRIEDATGIRFNSALANRYRAGHRDSIGMHSDSERELVGSPDPIIASVSLGRPCDFRMVPKKGRAGAPAKIRLTHGSLLVMGAGTQPNWLHGIDKEAAPAEADRINLTFRNIAIVKGTRP